MIKKIHRIDLEGFRVTQTMLEEQGEKTILRTFIRGVTSVEILGPGTKAFNRYSIQHRPDSRLQISTGNWILRDSAGNYAVVKHEEFQKNYSLKTDDDEHSES